ncbi:MAG: pyridine nucleotide-disulfide oxidoreductase [Flavobacteriales bacterium]|nr:pyridine nucleotide-disulfide oxidoreductase [Flavobacteriales bacterium]|tara:strand:+ start:18768 stop:20336 length:1569 start_codon:yes stop_codon:yes gene_type:complete
MDKYDLCVIGGGPAGYAAAMRAIDFGKKVLLVERDKLGGYGIYDGALASKTMWELSNKIKTVKDEIGQDKRIDLPFSKVKEVIDEALFERKFQLSCHLRIIHSETGLINYEKGQASFISDHEVLISKADGSSFSIYADNIIIATGSRPRTLKDIQVDEKTILTSDGILHLEQFPKSMVILGAGVIGCEFATMFSNFGQTKVHLIDRAERILPFEDEDVADVVATSLEENGVVIHRGAQLVRMDNNGDHVEYEIENSDGSHEVIQVEKAMLSIGRVPNIDNLNLDNANVQMSQRGVHIGDEDTRTNVPHIYAVGDVSGHLALVNVGEREARHAVVKMFADFPVKPIHYENISTIMFLSPEVAAVGVNEQQAEELQIPIRVSKVDYSTIARAIAMRKTNGFFKIIVSDDDDMKILGMRAIGEHASSAIQAVSLLMYMNKGIEELAHMIHPHPSIVEGVQECVRMLLGKSVYKSSIFKDKLKCYKRTVDGEILPLHTITMHSEKNQNRAKMREMSKNSDMRNTTA